MADLADVYVAFSGIGPALGTDEQIVGVTGSDVDDYGAFVTVGNGGAVTLVAGGAFDGDDCIKLVPPSNDFGGGDAQYCSVLRGANIWDDGDNDVGTINFRFLFRMATRYIDLASSPKWFSFGVASTLGGGRNDRIASFEQYWAPSTGRVICVTADEIQEYHNPHITDVYSPDGDDTRKLCIIRNGSANHSNDPPILGQEWVCIECQIDTRQNRGNPNGRNKIKIWTRDGVVNGQSLEIELTYDSGWNFTDQFISELEGLGWYFNDAGTANANNYIEYSHFVFSANRDKDDFIGPPPGFLDDDPPPDDTTPNAFSFTDQTGVSRSSTITSASITVSGIDAAAAISVSGGSYDINGSGTFVTTPGTVNNGNTVRARHTSSASYSTATNTTVTIGGVSDTFTSTTEADPGDDTTPNAFSFTDQSDVAVSTVITSAAITVAGINAPATISVSGGTYDVNGSGTFVSSPGTVELGDTVRARHTSSASYETATNTVVTIGGVSDTFTSTTGEAPSAWTDHDLSYLPIVPGSAGFGTNQYGGSGRHLGGSNEAAIFFVDDRGTGESGSWDSVTRIGYGTFKWCANHEEYGHVVWLVNGLFDYSGLSTGSRNIQVQNSYKTFHGHTAPGAMAFRGTNFITNGSHLCFWHIPVFQDLYADPEDVDSAGDCTQLLASPTPVGVLWANSLHWYGSDECVDWFRPIENAGLWQTIVGRALVDGNHPEGQHNYGVILANTADEISLGRVVLIHCQARHPLTSSPRLTMFNSLVYNWGNTGAQLIGTSPVATDTNIEGCLWVTGPDTEGPAIRLYDSMIAGSQVYVNGNRGFGVDDSELVENDEGLSLSGVRLTGAFPTGTGITAVGSSDDAKEAFAQLVIDHAGPRPLSRFSVIQASLNHILARFNGGDTGGYATTPSASGGFPSITEGPVLDPTDPGEFWGGVPCPMDLATRNEVMPSGYTRFEEWSHGVADQFMPSGWAGGDSGGGGDDTTPNAFSFTDRTGVARSSTMTSLPITVSGIDAPATITVIGGLYSINGGAFTSSPGTVENGDSVRASHTSSSSYSTARSTVVTIGGVSDTFTSTTESEIIIPAYRWFRVPRQ